MNAPWLHGGSGRAARAFAALALVAGIGVLTAGCFNPFMPSVLGRGVSIPPPTPNSASGVLQLLEWAYENRDYPVYKTLFTDDYRFVFGTLDTAGRAYQQIPWTREDEMAYARNLFEGEDASNPAATNIVLVLDKTFAESEDTREGKSDFSRFRKIRTQVQLNITDENGAQTNVTGKAVFFLVRGDSARIPDELGFGPDVNRWYINRWEDETFSPLAANLSGGGAASAAGARIRATPAGAEDGLLQASWGLVKRIYR